MFSTSIDQVQCDSEPFLEHHNKLWSFRVMDLSKVGGSTWNTAGKTQVDFSATGNTKEYSIIQSQKIDPCGDFKKDARHYRNTKEVHEVLAIKRTKNHRQFVGENIGTGSKLTF